MYNRVDHQLLTLARMLRECTSTCLLSSLGDVQLMFRVSACVNTSVWFTL